MAGGDFDVHIALYEWQVMNLLFTITDPAKFKIRNRNLLLMTCHAEGVNITEKPPAPSEKRRHNHLE